MKNKLIEPAPLDALKPFDVKSGKFNWFAEIDYILNGGIRTSMYLYVLASRANNWFSCACGQLDERIERFKDCHIKSYGPADEKLQELGMHFMVNINIAFDSDSIDFESLREAKQILIEIEQREAELLANLQ